MFGRVAVALLITASPAIAQDAPPAAAGEGAGAEAEAPVAYKTKKVCRSIEVVGSSIPRRACSTKRIPIKPDAKESETDSAEATQPQEPSTGQ